MEQLGALKKMGPLDQLVGMIPGMRGMPKADLDGKALTRTEAIINSMTPEERQDPRLIDGSRRKRIARGSGTSVQDVNRLLREFEAMKQMMKQFGRPGKRGGFPTASPFARS
jgi:signal recognition particle subunit SRP54